MPFVPALTILGKLRELLLAMPHPDQAMADAGEKLFERVEFHENKKLKEALADLTILKQRVAILVPGGDDYENKREGRAIRSTRSSTFDLLIADRAWTKGGHEAVFGGAKNVGVLTMQELVVNALCDNPQLGLAYVVLAPTGGAQITIADEDVKDSPGRECFVLNYETPSGERVINPTAPWPAV